MREYTKDEGMLGVNPTKIVTNASSTFLPLDSFLLMLSKDSWKDGSFLILLDSSDKLQDINNEHPLRVWENLKNSYLISLQTP